MKCGPLPRCYNTDLSVVVIPKLNSMTLKCPPMILLFDYLGKRKFRKFMYKCLLKPMEYKKLLSIVSLKDGGGRGKKHFPGMDRY